MHTQECCCPENGKLMSQYMYQLKNTELNSKEFAHTVEELYYEDNELKELILNNVNEVIKESILEGFETIDFSMIP